MRRSPSGTKRVSNHYREDILSMEAREKERRRREWMIQQRKEEAHEKLKQKKIAEYERKRQEQLKKEQEERERAKISKGKSSNRSKSRSRSREPLYRTVTQQGSSSKSTRLSDKEEFSSGSSGLFKGSDKISRINKVDLCRIKVDIIRKIPGNVTPSSGELHRDIIDPEDLHLKRRDGEGSKPIFDREELNSKSSCQSDVEERRIVKSVDCDYDDSRRKRSSSRSSRRHRSVSPCNSRSRYERSVESSRRSDRYDSRHRRDESGDRRHRSSRRSREDYKRRSSRDSRSNRDYRGSSRDRSRESRDHRGQPRDQRLPVGPYMDPIMPIYYGPFPRMPYMPGPMMPMRGMMPPMGRALPLSVGPMPPQMRPRFMPQDMHGPYMSHNSSRGRMH